jgi:cellulose synthase/poly-beta-1,6-N-acetylglucosamine synthase-like glycosyltransferase
MAGSETPNRRLALLLGVLAAAVYVVFPSIKSAGLFVVWAISLMVTITLAAVTVRRAVLASAAPRVPEPIDGIPPTELPCVSVFIPCHNEAAVLEQCFEALALVDYPANSLEIVVIDDASTDQTSAIAESFSGRFAYFDLIRREPGKGARGKPGALIQALAAHSDQQVCYFLDADTRLGPKAIRHAVSALAFDEIGAVTGPLLPSNFDASPTALYASVESWTHQFATLYPASRMHLTSAALGGNWAIRRNLLDQFGLGEGELLEDSDISVRLQNSGFRILFDPGMNAETQVPETLADYFWQHVGWGRGFLRIGKRRSGSILDGAGSMVQKADRLIYAWGYLDRPLLALFVLFAIANTRGLDLIAPNWLLASVILAPIFQMAVGIRSAGKTSVKAEMLFWLPAMFAVDLAAAITAFAQDLIGKPLRWYKTGRHGDDGLGGFLDATGDADD